MNISGIGSGHPLNSQRKTGDRTANMEAAFSTVLKRKQDQATFSSTSSLFATNLPSAVNKDRNAIDLKPDQAYSVGIVNGHQLNVRFFQGGGIETNHNLAFHAGEPGSAVTAYQLQVAKAYQELLPDEHLKENQLVGRLHDLTDVADGKMSVAEFNNRDSLSYVAKTSEMLGTLGIDSSKPFTVNGKTFTLENGKLKNL